MNLIDNTGDLPLIPMPEVGNESPASFWADLKGLGFDEIVSKIANGAVSFAFKLALAILVFYLGRYIIRKLYNVVYRMLTSRNVEASLVTFSLSMVRIVLYFILIITVIGILGIETSSFLALFASAGVAVGMALSGTLQNFAGGVLILLLKPYRVGDFIEVQGYSGTVKSIQLFNTIINTPDNKAIILPNGMLSTSSINNYSLEQYRRVDWDVSLAYGTDVEAAKAALLEILLEDDRVVEKYVEDDIKKRHEENQKSRSSILSTPEMPVDLPNKADRAPFVALKEMGDSAIVVTARAWTHVSNYWPLFFSMNEKIYATLPEKGFSFPFPQLDVHMAKE